MTIQQCKYVLKIQKKGSFNEAAKELFVAQSSLSGSVKQLEAELGIRIFERSKNGVALTSDGAEFVKYAAQLVEKEEFIMSRYRSSVSGARLNVSTQHYDFIADVFCSLLSSSDAESYDLSLQEKQTYEVIRDVETAYSDIGIIAIKDEDMDIMNRYLLSRGVVFSELLRASPHIFVRREHPVSGKQTLSFELLSRFPYVSYEQGAHSDSLFTEEMFSGDGSKKRVIISDRATLMNVLLKTDAYTVGTGIMPSALNDGKIVSIPFESDSFYHVGYLYKKDRQPTETVERFVRLLSGFAADLII